MPRDHGDAGGRDHQLLVHADRTGHRGELPLQRGVRCHDDRIRARLVHHEHPRARGRRRTDGVRRRPRGGRVVPHRCGVHVDQHHVRVGDVLQERRGVRRAGDHDRDRGGVRHAVRVVRRRRRGGRDRDRCARRGGHGGGQLPRVQRGADSHAGGMGVRARRAERRGDHPDGAPDVGSNRLTVLGADFRRESDVRL